MNQVKVRVESWAIVGLSDSEVLHKYNELSNSIDRVREQLELAQQAIVANANTREQAIKKLPAGSGRFAVKTKVQFEIRLSDKQQDKAQGVEKLTYRFTEEAELTLLINGSRFPSYVANTKLNRLQGLVPIKPKAQMSLELHRSNGIKSDKRTTIDIAASNFAVALNRTGLVKALPFISRLDQIAIVNDDGNSDILKKTKLAVLALS